MNSFHVLAAWLPSLCRSLVLIGLSVLIQSGLLLIVGLLAARALRRHGPSTQRFVYQATLTGVAACCVLTVSLAGNRPALYSLSLPEARTLPMTVARSVSAGPATISTDSAPATATAPHASTPRASPAMSQDGAAANGAQIEVQPDATPAGNPAADAFPESDHPPFLPETVPMQTSRAGWLYIGIAAVWVFGLMAQCAWLLACSQGIRRICRQSTPVADSNATTLLASLCAAQGLHPPQLRTSTAVESVYLAGLRRPVILLPASYTTDFDAPTLRAILAHEVAHFALRDAWWDWGARLLCAVFWVQPLLQHVCRQREQVCEEVCDMVALTQDCSPRLYAECLLALSERLTNARSPRLLISGVVTFRSSLGQRVQQILRGPRPIKPLAASFRVGVTVSLATMVAALLFTISATAVQEENAWDKDARLTRKVSISAEGIPVRDLLALLSQKTGVLLKAEDYVADDKVIVFTPARPLRDTLADIAALFDDAWLSRKTKENTNYFLLVRNRPAKDYEDGLSQDRNRKMLAQLDAQIKALDETPQELERRPAGDPIRAALSTADGRLGTSVFALLNAEQRTQLMENWRTQISVTLLSPEQKKALEPLFFGDKFKPEANNGFVLNQIPREEMDKHDMRFNLIGNNGALSVYMTAPIGFNMEVTTFSAAAKFLLPPHGNPYTGKAVRSSADLPDPQTLGAISGASWVDRLHSLATKAGVPVIADFYRSKPIHAADGEQDISKDRAFQALDAFSRPEGYAWWTRGKSLLLRKRDWYNQRLYEVPDRWVEAVGRRVNAHRDALTYADVLSLTDLSMDQIVGLNESLGLRANRDVLSGLPAMLASLAACSIDKNTPLYKGVVSGTTALEKSVRPNLNDAQQLALMGSFLHAFSRDLIQGGDPREFGYLILPHGGPAVGEPVGGPVQIDVLFAGHNSLGAGYILSLPTSLPGDRRANTQIDLTP
ncbi:MAG: blaR0 [Chthonomonadaceae bacterium]|nr:blaR0 [Chthonomonadaceae bacterium]